MKLHQIRNIFPHNAVARYNLAVWQSSTEESLSFIGREVNKPGGEGEPDTGVLKLFKVSIDGLTLKEKVFWKPVYDGINLEDPRVIEIQGSLVIGLTAVLRNKEGKPLPFPSIVKIDSVNLWKHEMPPFLIIDSFGPGKNLTPVDAHTYFFRPESEEYNHKLLVFSLHSQVPEKMGDIEFPTDIPWAEWRIGTTMPPLWVTPTEAIFIIHGISLRKVNGKDIYVYSIGRAKLTHEHANYRVTVAPDPILTPDMFIDKHGNPLVKELHPEIRRVVYSCGGLIKRNTQDRLSLFVNVGDMATFEVEMSLAELKAGLFSKVS